MEYDDKQKKRMTGNKGLRRVLRVTNEKNDRKW